MAQYGKFPAMEAALARNIQVQVSGDKNDRWEHAFLDISSVIKH
jgi:hypothetical protein